MNKRIENFRERIQSNNLQGFIVYNPINIKYFTGLDAEGVLLITEYDNIFITDSRYTEYANSSITIEDEIIVQDIKNLTDEDLLIYFSNCERVGFEEKYVTYANYRNMLMKFRIKEAVESNNIIEDMRQIKSNNEMALIETACNITDSCFLHLRDFIKIGMTEKQIAFEAQKFFMENKADGLAFDTIVASGKNTSKPHAIPSDKKIEYGDAVLIDFGARYKGYCADMTRTLFVGEASEKQKEIYDLVFNTQNRALNKMKNNADTKELSNYVKNEFNSRGYDLIHALGHGVGLEVHEKPFFSTSLAGTLKLGMIVTNEPGIYIPGEFGVRIEDTLLINNMEPTVLTKSNKNLIVINN